MVTTQEHEPKWRRLPEERPQQILEAAYRVFGERGLAGARLEDIAKRAGVSKGTIYLYFPNKEELFKEMIRQTVIVELERSERDLVNNPRTTAKQQLTDYMRQWWTAMRAPEFQTIYRLVISELHRFPELLEFYWREVVARKHQLVGRMIQRGIDSGEFDAIDPVVAGRIMASMFASHALWSNMRGCLPDSLSGHEVFDQLTGFFFRAVAPPVRPASPTPTHGR
jgi:AcrR family transcriptional regulator